MYITLKNKATPVKSLASLANRDCFFFLKENRESFFNYIFHEPNRLTEAYWVHS